jgi:cysteinyl-tRNA synthetase
MEESAGRLTPVLRLFNTLDRSIKPFRPANRALAAIFTCGPSVYQKAHIGNFRTFLFEDILVRYLEYSGYNVKWGMTITDVEDKAIVQATRQRSTLKRLTDSNLKEFLEEMKLLRIRIPDHLPRASESINEATAIITRLLDLGVAYWYKGNVYFDPLTFPGFGKLYGLDMSKWPAKKKRFHKDTYPGIQWNLGDFILWHGYHRGDRVFWESRIGRGRPSWNIQDPAMISRYYNETLSIYCGGIDNLYRHHDYTRAILESVRHYPVARFWLHCRHLLVKGQKMSKSRGNMHYADTLLSKGYSPAQVRFFLCYGHYRDELDFSDQAMAATTGRLSEFRRRVNAVAGAAGKEHGDGVEASLLRSVFLKEMDNDLNVKEAFDGLDRLLSQIRIRDLRPGDARDVVDVLRQIDQVLQVIF